MSPIIELQRRMVEAGRIRAGEKGDKGEPRKLDKWRLTSKDRARLEEAAKLWGGEVQEWNGQFELYTETAELPIAILTGQEATTWYELWSRGGCQRRCDGVHEVMSDSACLCDADERECKPHTRISVFLPDIPGFGSWLVTSTGWNAAVELGGLANLLCNTPSGILLNARLLLEQRVSVKAGQTRRFAVPVIDMDVAFRSLMGQQDALGSSERPALPSGYTPVPGNGGTGTSLADGLAAAETQELKRTTRSAAPIPAGDDTSFGETPVPVDTDSGAPASNPEGSPTAPRSDKPLTKAQKDKLNVLVGTLRDAGRITTEQLYVKLAQMRQVTVDTLIGLTTDARDAVGSLHWAPLRETLMRDEASTLIDALERFEAEQAS